MNDDTRVSTSGEVSAYQSALASVPSGAEIKAAAEDTAGEAVRLARENVGLVLAGGLAIGVLTAALWPRSKGRKIAKKARGISALATELGAALLAQAADKASETKGKVEDLSKSASETVADQSEAISKQAQRLVSEAADQLNDSGKAIARKVVNFIEKAQR